MAGGYHPDAIAAPAGIPAAPNRSWSPPWQAGPNDPTGRGYPRFKVDLKS